MTASNENREGSNGDVIASRRKRWTEYTCTERVAVDSPKTYFRENAYFSSRLLGALVEIQLISEAAAKLRANVFEHEQLPISFLSW